jgi:hypothetical protein
MPGDRPIAGVTSTDQERCRKKWGPIGEKCTTACITDYQVPGPKTFLRLFSALLLYKQDASGWQFLERSPPVFGRFFAASHYRYGR